MLLFFAFVPFADTLLGSAEEGRNPLRLCKPVDPAHAATLADCLPYGILFAMPLSAWQRIDGAGQLRGFSSGPAGPPCVPYRKPARENLPVLVNGIPDGCRYYF